MSAQSRYQRGKIDRSTVRRVLKRWEQEGPEGLEDRKCGRPKGVQKVALRAMAEVRRRQENPELGAYRMRAALEQVGIHLSTGTVGRVLAANREAEGLPKPRRSPHTKRDRLRLPEALADLRRGGLACCEVAVWIGDDGLVVEYGGETLSRYDVSFSSGAQRLDALTNVRLYATRHRSPQLKLFALEDTGWLKALAPDGYAPRSRSKPPEMLQGALFSYLEAP